MNDHKLPILELNDFERLWLEELYGYVKKNIRPTYRQIWSKLIGKIPKDFTPAIIDQTLCDITGERITLLGVIAIERAIK
jgi:hypothetical protein